VITVPDRRRQTELLLDRRTIDLLWHPPRYM